MAIVKMKRLRLVGLAADRDALFSGLQAMGCVEVSQQKDKLADPKWAGLMHQGTSDLLERQGQRDAVQTALEILEKHAKPKTPLFGPYDPITRGALFDEERLRSALTLADELCGYDKRLGELTAEESRLKTARATLAPWQSLDVSLQLRSTGELYVAFGMIPASIPLEEVRKDLALNADASELYEASTDRDMHYLLFVCHQSQREAALDVLKAHAFSHTDFKGSDGTAAVELGEIEEKLSAISDERERVESAICGYGDQYKLLLQASDRLAVEVQKETDKGWVLLSDDAFYLEGWATVPSLPELTRFLEQHDCAYEFSDPAPEDDVPVLLKSNKLTDPMNMVTEMYSLPAYSGIDPNPLILPWFTLFFGIMYADLGYGLVLLILGLLGTKFIKKPGTLKHMTGLLILCGITTAVCGILFGSFFGDAVPVVTNLLGLPEKQLWHLIDPLEDPMVMLVASLVLGFVHLLTGMVIHAYMCFRDGHPLDGILDVLPWWVLFAGIGLLVLGYGWYVMAAGALFLVLTQGRAKPTIVGKITGGFASLYDITSWLGDILSYSRLMALMLASSVIGNVVNALGSMAGSIVVFVIVFLIGHVFNMGINIIGTYVHAARLQYLEFFGKFYQDGGRAFEPLQYQTNYVYLKEEK